MRYLLLVGEEFGQSALGVSADALKQIAQISEGIDTESLRSRDEAAEHGGGAPAVVATRTFAVEGSLRQ